MQQQLYLICYDIRDDGNRLKVSDLLEMYGGSRRNKSVFEISLYAYQMLNIVQEIERWIEKDSDVILCYRICRVCYENSIFLPEDIH